MMRAVYLVILLFIISCSQSQNQEIGSILENPLNKTTGTIKLEDSVSIQQFPENDLFYDEVNTRAAKIKNMLDSLDVIKYNNCLHNILPEPIVFDTLTKNFAVTYVIRNDLDILHYISGSYVGNYASKVIEIRISQDRKNIHKSVISNKLFFVYFHPDWEKNVKEYQIVRIENIDITEHFVLFEIMLCKPESDLDAYFELVINHDNSILIRDVTEKYYVNEEL